MKYTIKTIGLLIAVLVIFASCEDQVSKDPIGRWDDNIKLSTKSVDFKSTLDSVIISTEGDWWWIDGVMVDNTTYSFYGSDDIDLESEHYTIKQDCFVVERRNKHTLFVKLEANETGLERVITILFEAGDYFDRVTIRQAAD